MGNPVGYEYYRTFDVTVHATYEKKYRLRAMNEDHALGVAKNRLNKRKKSTDRKGLSIVDVVGVSIKRVHEDDNE